MKSCAGVSSASAVKEENEKMAGSPGLLGWYG